MERNEALQTAKERLEKQAETIEDYEEKLAEAQRRQRAEDIVEMKIAAGTVDPADFLDEREQLVNSEKDLRETKTAMQEAGPGFTSDDRSIVDLDDEEGPKKEASDSEDNDHVKAARENLSSKMGEMGLS